MCAGSPGVGKTGPAREGVLAERSGAATAWVNGTRSGADLPFVAHTPPVPSRQDERLEENRAEPLRRSTAALAEPEGPALAFVVDDGHLLVDVFCDTTP